MATMNQTDRLAMYLVKAVVANRQPSDIKLTAAGRPAAIGLRDAMDLVAAQAASQGIKPVDLDREEGRDALSAIADVVMMRKKQSNAFGEPVQTTVFHRLPREWQHVTLHAKRLLDLILNPPTSK